MAKNLKIRSTPFPSHSNCVVAILCLLITHRPQISLAFRCWRTTSLTFLRPTAYGTRSASAVLVLACMGRRDAFSSSSRDLSNTSNVTLEPRKYGYAETPYTWKQLVQIIDQEQNLAKLSRSVAQQREYQVYRQSLLREWKSVYDHILVSKFDFERRLVANPDSSLDGRNATLWEAYPSLTEISQVRLALRPNDFPYYLPDHIEHWCLWKLCENVTDGEIEEAKEDLRKMHGDVLDFLHWTNPPHLKSLPDIDHAHIVCLRTRERDR